MHILVCTHTRIVPQFKTHHDLAPLGLQSHEQDTSSRPLNPRSSVNSYSKHINELLNKNKSKHVIIYILPS